MKVEMDEYLGRDCKDKKAKIKKHAGTDEGLNSHKVGLAAFTSGAEQ